MREGAFVSLAGKGRILALVFFIIVLAGCQQAPTGPQVLMDADIQGMEEFRDAWVKAWLANDASLLDELVTDDAIRMPPNGEMVQGRADVLAFHEDFLKQYKVTGLTLTPVETVGLGDVVYEIGNFTVAVEPTSPLAPTAGKYLGIFRKQADGSWKLAADIYNSDQPPSQQGESESSN